MNLFLKKEKLPKGITSSWQDIKRRIRIPEDITEELAEEIGIHIGDGNLYVSGKKNIFYRYNISGDLLNELIYHQGYLKELMKKLYNLEPTLILRDNKNSVDTTIKSKAIVEFKNKILGLPIGPKRNIKIPDSIRINKDFQKRGISGIIDTDFNITSSLAITGKLHSLNIVRDINKILEANNIPHVFKLYPEYGRFYINKEGAVKIIENWELHNQKHLSKYQLFKEFRKFIPYSTTPERLAVLSGKLDINDLTKICEKRASSKL